VLRASVTRLRWAAAAVAIVAAVLVAGRSEAVDPETSAANAAIAYINGLQNTDGGFPAFGSTSSAGATLDAVFAYTAAGVDPKTVTNGGQGPDDYLATQAASYSGTAGGAAKLMLGIVAMDLDTSDFGGVDVFSVTESYLNAGTGQFGDDVFAQSLYMLARAALGESIPLNSVDYLESLQLPSGGWEFCCGFGADTNATALAVRALAVSGTADPGAIADGLAYLAASQQADGGFPYVAPGDSDPNSTALVIQALLTAGEGLDIGGPWDAGAGNTPLTALRSFQNPATGALKYSGEDSAFATYQGVPGLMLAAFPELPDPDGDGLDYAADNCPTVVNAGQTNTDGDKSGDACDADDDNDGCSDGRENGSIPTLGGLRNPLNFWDFFDTPTGPMLLRDRAVTVGDIAAVVARFGSSGSKAIDPLSVPGAAPAYHTGYDRTAAGENPNGLALGPNGSVTVQDVSLNVAQFGHSCVT
jgi:hypothetical protein